MGNMMILDAMYTYDGDSPSAGDLPAFVHLRRYESTLEARADSCFKQRLPNHPDHAIEGPYSMQVFCLPDDHQFDRLLLGAGMSYKDYREFALKADALAITRAVENLFHLFKERSIG